MDLALNSPQWLMCHKTKPKPNQIKLTRDNLLVEFANHYTTRGTLYISMWVRAFLHEYVYVEA